ncbi:rab-GTPase-TBC domain-containing protein [Fimicolochytrium jonesii]|uniref:rab-GTPase-TBC domain-containing protein n=1 Tax=Fimicolochytrium jonesii TaxID=1396493 RepID=UPI0022FE062A|nr:rab-GTPase-TBC domain-containing protein [Fimicolochytrium jonesii]KAI8827221.1 rab-GTPase-TBC domain-containing protein [Fimicolochytrium jonesii]
MLSQTSSPQRKSAWTRISSRRSGAAAGKTPATPTTPTTTTTTTVAFGTTVTSPSRPPTGRPSTTTPSSREGRSSTPHHHHTPTPTTTTSSLHAHSTRAKYEHLLATRNTTDADLRDNLRKLRRLILSDGLPSDASDAPNSVLDCSLRGRVWKVLLGIYRLSATEYTSLVERGPASSVVYEKIKNDTFRTLATDKRFLAKVDEHMISRVLNAFVNKMMDVPPSRLLNLTYTYVQGMNVLAAPFLYVMPELDAFYTFTAFVQNACPLYVQPALEGVHCGLRLLDKCFQVCDPILYRYLKSKKLTAKLYAFPSVLTFSACTPPLPPVLHLWDFLLAHGPHLNLLCIIAQLLLIRSELLASPQPMKLLRTFPEIDAKRVVQVTVGLVARLPEDLYDMLVRHPFDAGIYDVVMGEVGEDGGEAGEGGMEWAEA